MVVLNTGSLEKKGTNQLEIFKDYFIALSFQIKCLIPLVINTLIIISNFNAPLEKFP